LLWDLGLYAGGPPAGTVGSMAEFDARPGSTAAGRSHSLRIGRIAGIDIRIHISFFILVVLFAIAGTEPGGPGVLGALGWLAIIFTCVVLHELAHCLVGRPRGAVVHEIELLPIGGVSKLEKLPEGPADEFAMAIAGPAASVGIAAVCALMAFALSQPLLPIDIFGGPLLARVVWLNLILAVFNLVPAFPLDGGRVFRALLERRYDLEAATRVAARVGRGMAIVFVAIGLFWNIWLIIIGVFVYLGASAEEAATIVHVRLAHRCVGDVMLLDPVTVDPTASADELRTLLRRSPQRVFPVVGPGGYEGLIDSDSIEHSDPASTAATLVERAAPVVAATDGLEDCLPLVAGAPGRALAVVDEGRLVGLLRGEDVEHVVRAVMRRATAGGESSQ
jgi:Zn-dependent protease